ncbi:MAG: XtrA/YqaO family protein [Sporolactobacillus sp.]
MASSPKSTKELRINRNGKSVTQNIEPGKVLVVVFDGVQGKAKVTEAAEHGLTIRETAKGKVAKIKYDKGELF